MSQNFVVNYDINVLSEDAVQSVGRFTLATQQLKKAQDPFIKLNQKINNLKNGLTALNKVRSEVFINTKTAEANIDRLQGKIEKLKTTLRSMNMTLATGGGDIAAASGTRGGATRSSKSSRGFIYGSSIYPDISDKRAIADMREAYLKQAKADARRMGIDPKRSKFISNATIGAQRARFDAMYADHPDMMGKWIETDKKFRSRNAMRGGRHVGGRSGSSSIYPNALGYKTLGATPLDVGGSIGIDVMKGMGVAYGIAGAGTAIGSAISDATAYDNTIQTTKNILHSHDNRPNFEGRFRGMEDIIRQVGIKTKFTAPQVADASKFLAMAGLNIEAINEAIRPIADIALIADTDLGETADVVTNIMTAYGMQPKQMRDIADQMTMTFTMSNTTLPEMAESYKYFASIARANNWGFDETTGMIGVLGDAGLKGSHAGTTIRQLMNNLLKPSKGQKAALDKFGVKTRNADGTLRSPFEIFSELAAAGAQSSTFDLFRVTAAQGGVSLMQSIEKWKSIIEENKKASGLSSKLASEKQNTVQGLWAQMTSSFTEDAMRGFENVRPEITNMLKNVTQWLNSDEARAKIKSFAQDFIDFAKAIGDVSKQFIDLYERFKGPILGLIKLQLRLAPLIYTLRTLKSFFLGGLGVLKFAGSIGKLTSALHGMGRELKMITHRNGGLAGLAAYTKDLSGNFEGAANGAKKGVNGASRISGVPSRRAYERWHAFNNNLHEVNGKYITQDKFDRYMSIQHRGLWGRWTRAARFNPGTLGMLGSTMAGSLGGYSLGQALGGDDGAMWGLGVGTLAPMLGFAISNPVGWAVTIGAAITGLGAAFYNMAKASDNARAANDKFIESVHTVNGMLQGDGISTTQRYLNLLYDKEMDVNQVIRERIRLRRQELGLTDAGSNDEGNAFHGEQFDKAYQIFKDNNPWNNWGGGFLTDALKQRVNTLSGFYVQDPKTGKYLSGQGGPERVHTVGGRDYYWHDINGKSHLIQNPNGWKDPMDVVSVAGALYAEGVAGKAANEVVEEFTERIQNASERGNMQDFYAIKRDFINRFSIKVPASSIDKFDWGPDEVNNKTNKEKANTYFFQQGIYDRLNPMFGKDAPVWSAADKYYDELKNGKLTEKIVVDFLKTTHPELGAELLRGYDYGINNMLAEIGFDTKTGKFVAKGGVESSRHAENAVTNFKALLEVISKLPTPAQNAVANLTLLANQMLNIANGTVWGFNNLNADGTGAKDGEFRTVNGLKYKYNAKTKKWEPYDSIGLPMTDKQMVGALNEANNSPSPTPTPTPTSNSFKPVGGDQSQYKSHYQNSSAAPKQVIVKIENLMNVKSIDLTNPDNTAVIDDVKQQLTQALIDVVHDFDETFHG